MISQELIREFKQIFKEEYGVEYTDQEAHEAANNLVGFFELLMKVDMRNKEKEDEERTKNQTKIRLR